CLYHWVEHPDFEREVAIVALRAPHVPALLGRQVAAAVEKLRGMGLYKPPGVAETIDWAEAIAALGARVLDEATVERTLGAAVKYREDAQRVREEGLAQLTASAVAGAG
ncbi:MAG: AAA family ATPase, partial [Acidimicrobiales bacterium]